MCSREGVFVCVFTVCRWGRVTANKDSMTFKMIGKLLGMSWLFQQSNTSPTPPLSSLTLSLFPAIQNKCVRYWPDLHSTKEFGKVLVRNVDERPAQDYVLRKLEVTRLDRVGKAVQLIRADPLTRGQIISHVLHTDTLNPTACSCGFKRISEI